MPIVGPSGTDYPSNIVNNQYDFVDMDYNAGGISPFGSGWHGNAVAGIATGLLGNGGGSAGTGGQASDPYLSKRGLTSDYTYKAVKTARFWGMDVINMSYGAPCTDDCAEYDPPRDEIDAAVAAGIVVVAAAGNDGSNATIATIQPCTLPGVIW
jgi:subtilisin family serine protease